MLLIFSFLSNATFAVTKVTISDVHICCVTCQETIENAVLGVKGTNVKVDRDAKTVAVSANDDSLVQEALDALAMAGFYGKSDNDTVEMKASPVDGKLSSAELVGFHNCCGGCSSSIEDAITSADSCSSVATTGMSITSVSNVFSIKLIFR